MLVFVSIIRFIISQRYQCVKSDGVHPVSVYSYQKCVPQGSVLGDVVSAVSYGHADQHLYADGTIADILCG